MAWNNRSRLPLLRPRFSLLAMLVVITVVAIPLSYVAQRRSWNFEPKFGGEGLQRVI